MGTFCDVFERTEKKYRLQASQHRAIMRALEGRMAVDEYGTTQVMSLYYDTPERLLIERSLDKPLYKEKLRVRSYGPPTAASRVFIEVKEKYKGVVYKRRVGCSYAAAQAYLGGMPYATACARYPLGDPALDAESKGERSLQIAREIDALRARYNNLRPSMLIVCDRVAYVPCDATDEGLRITFDTALSCCDHLDPQASMQAVLHSGESIMEIKNAGPMPLWLTHALAACKAYPASFSKYGEAYRLCATQSQPSRSRRASAARPVAEASATALSRRAKAPQVGSRGKRPLHAAFAKKSPEKASSERTMTCA